MHKKTLLALLSICASFGGLAQAGEAEDAYDRVLAAATAIVEPPETIFAQLAGTVPDFRLAKKSDPSTPHTASQAILSTDPLAMLVFGNDGLLALSQVASCARMGRVTREILRRQTGQDPILLDIPSEREQVPITFPALMDCMLALPVKGDPVAIIHALAVRAKVDFKTVDFPENLVSVDFTKSEVPVLTAHDGRAGSVALDNFVLYLGTTKRYPGIVIMRLGLQAHETG